MDWQLNVGVVCKMAALCRAACTRMHTIISYSKKEYSKSVTWLKKWGRRDMKRRIMVAEGEDERLRLRMLKKTAMIPSLVKLKASEDLKSLPRDGSITRVRNRCILTDRPRGVITQYHMSRHKFKRLADGGLIPGLTRSSW